MTMAIGPVRAGESLTYTCLFLEDDGSPLDITGATLQMVFAPIPGSPATNARFVGSGAFNVYQGTGGMATYALTSGDTTGHVGTWLLQAVATLPNGNTRYSDAVMLPIEAPL